MFDPIKFEASDFVKSVDRSAGWPLLLIDFNAIFICHFSAAAAVVGNGAGAGTVFGAINRWLGNILLFLLLLLLLPVPSLERDLARALACGMVYFTLSKFTDLV